MTATWPPKTHECTCPRNQARWPDPVGDDPDPDPMCPQHGDPNVWPPPAFPTTDQSLSGTAWSRDPSRTHVCGRCGAIVADDLRRDNYQPYRLGWVEHGEFHRAMDWAMLLGPKAPLYAAAGMTLKEAVGLERSEHPPTYATLNALVGLATAEPASD